MTISDDLPYDEPEDRKARRDAAFEYLIGYTIIALAIIITIISLATTTQFMSAVIVLSIAWMLGIWFARKLPAIIAFAESDQNLKELIVEKAEQKRVAIQREKFQGTTLASVDDDCVMPLTNDEADTFRSITRDIPKDID